MTYLALLTGYSQTTDEKIRNFFQPHVYSALPKG